MKEITKMGLQAEVWKIMAEANHIPRKTFESHSKNKSDAVKEAAKYIDKGLSLPLDEIKNTSLNFTMHFRKAVELLRAERNGYSNEALHVPVATLNRLFQEHTITDESDLPF